LKQKLGSVPRAETLPTGHAALDQALGGGLPRGRLVELSGPWSSGKGSLALTAAARVTASRRLCAWVDARGELYPPSAAALGVDLGRLLVVRPPSGGSARAGEIAARSGAFPLVVLDLPDGERVEEAAAGRLRAAATGSGCVVVALAARPGALAQAPLKLEISDMGGVVTVRKGGAAPPGTRVAWADRGFTPAPKVGLGRMVLR
jgi:hypothetical protein